MDGRRCEGRRTVGHRSGTDPLLSQDSEWVRGSTHGNRRPSVTVCPIRDQRHRWTVSEPTSVYRMSHTPPSPE